ncbi:lectin-like domain-containing protein [Hymenobacter sp. GOD-10R]|uniref:T9SS type A sorting domain-containing protein n=1 Tax=Hymenobacter sp. GOD-10R TaxID=3093922 RepID=UPI002D78442A|nr:T9SS type A sorting domain-containing protein [Hymenobacter sp. GOD-10R]WRQ28253.1 T9SS type A sorting domain-containing protein [Hymenobacter sp. GOD-10R]
MKTFSTLLSTYSLSHRLRFGLLTLLGSAALTPALAQSTPAGFPRNETFKGNTASNFDFGGTARLTGTSTLGNDINGQGYLRLTDASTFQAGYVIDKIGFSSAAGFTISFEFFSYGGNGADGFSVFLVDADQPSTGFRIGSTGGALGYAQRNITPIADGVSKGYIGIGIDEYGNYANGSEGRVGGYNNTKDNTTFPNAVSIRGAGNGSSTTDYPYLTGTGSDALGFPLAVGTSRAQPGSADYRRAFIDVVASGTAPNQTYKITVRIQHGNQVRTAVENFTVNTPPDRLRLGFAGSTGSLTNIHEIRNLNIVRVPYANNDVATTTYNSNPITIDVLSNDEAQGSSIDPATVDLDPNRDGIQSSVAVAGKGTFSVNSAGIVTFKPSGTFAGVVEVPYTMQSILGASYTSSPANISVTVQGADVATTMSGPSVVQTNSLVTYSMSTSNSGSLPATNVQPTMQLPIAMPRGRIKEISNDGTYNPLTGQVTFPAINSLASGAAPVTNSVSFFVPVTLSQTLTTEATSASTTPDPTPSNNTASMLAKVGAPLPVELTAFSARADREDAQLNWATASEKDNDHFEVERSTDGANFSKVGQVQGKGTTSAASAYAHRDVRAARLGARTVYYRLRQVDTDGDSKYSNVETVQFATAKTSISLYPNPSAGSATLDLTELAPGDYAIQMLDITGRVVREQKLAGAQEHVFDVQDLRQGSYIVRVRGGATNVTLPLVRN